MNKVIINKMDEYNYHNLVESVNKIIDNCNINIKKEKVAMIILKPNLCYYWSHNTGQTTSPYLVSAIIDVLRDKIGNDVDISIAESDATAMQTKYAFKFLGFEEIAVKKNVGLINLSESEQVSKDHFHLSKTLFDCDLLINIPKLKTHPLTLVSCAIKNIFGMVSEPNKVKFHPKLNSIIAEAHKSLFQKPELTITDGIIAAGSHPIKLGGLIAGRDPLAVDWINSKIMGINPKRVKHLMACKRNNLTDISNIKVVGYDINELKAAFPSVNYTIVNAKRSILLKALKLYTKISGDIMLPYWE